MLSLVVLFAVKIAGVWPECSSKLSLQAYLVVVGGVVCSEDRWSLAKMLTDSDGVGGFHGLKVVLVVTGHSIIKSGDQQ